MTKISKPRNTNIELLRIIAMLFIVIGHFNGQAGFNLFSFSANSFLITILGSGSRLAVNIFLIIGVWFMVDAKFSGKRIMIVWSQVAFYTYIITTLMIILRAPISIKDIFRGFLPFIGRGLWFASAYITLMLVAPFLNRVFLWKPLQQRLLIIIMFAAICLVSTLPDLQQAYLCDSLWFWFVYLAVGYYKKELFEKHRAKLEKTKLFSLLAGIGLYITLCLVFHIGTIYRENSSLFSLLHNLAFQYISDIKTLPNFMSAFLIFNYVILCRARTSNVIQNIAAASFSVYIVHQVPSFIQFLWSTICQAERFRMMDWSVLYMIFISISVYLVVWVIDNGRRVIEKRWMSSKLFIRMTGWIDAEYEKADMTK